MRAFAILPLLWLLPMAAAAQGVIAVAPGAGSPARVAPSAKLAVPIVVEMSAAAGANLAVFTTGVTWNADRLTLDSVQAAFPTLTADLTNRASGSASLTFANAMGNTQTLGTLHFTASAATGGASIRLSPTVATNETGASILPMVQSRLLNVCVAPSGRWGDANGDTLVNIIDAQQIARFTVGLTVANLAAVTALGDVTGDGTVNIIDAQQIARFTVGLTAPARTATLVAAPVSVASTVVSPTVTTLAAGQTLLLVATPTDAANGSLAGCSGVTWTSLNPAVATVDTTGLVTAVSAGTASFTVTSGGQSASAAITVAVVHVASVGLAPATGSIYAGSTLQLTATPKDSIGGALSGRPVTWTSSDTTVANVSAAGLVIAKAPGAATVTAMSEGVSSTAAALTVALVPVASVSVPSDTGVLFVGRTRQLTATLKDSAGNVLTGRTILWQSSDTTAATVSTSGIVTAVAAGSATISATSGTANAQVGVRSALRTVAAVAAMPKAPALIAGDSLPLRVIATDVYGDTLTGQATTWVSADPTLATVSVGGVARGLAVGKARIVGTVGVKSDTATVDVRLASTATVTVNGTDSATVAVASGSSVTVAAGALAAGTTIRVADATPMSSDIDGALGNAVILTISPPGGAVAAAMPPFQLRLANASVGSGLIAHIRQTVDAGVNLASTNVVLAVNAAGDEAHKLFLGAVNFTVTAGETGKQVIDFAYDATNDVGGLAFQFLFNVPYSCSRYAWTLSNYSNPGHAHDPTKVPVILVHGWQPLVKTCLDVENYNPTVGVDVWSTLAPAIRDDLGNRYEVWIYRYPSMDLVQTNADVLRQKMLDEGLGVPERAVMVAHSMGGLVAGVAMQDDQFQLVKELITLNTPFEGTPLADVDVSSASQRDQLSQCLNVQDWSAGRVAQVLQGARAWAEGTPGARDLSPKTSTVLWRFSGTPPFAKRLTSYTSTQSWTTHAAGALDFEALGGCLLQVGGYGPSDGAVPETRTRLSNAQETLDTRTLSTSLRHTALPTNSVGVQAVKDRLTSRSSVFRVAIAPSPITVGVNQPTALSATLVDANGFKLPPRPVDWSVQPSTVASITQNGLLTGLATGDATVSVVLRIADPGEISSGTVAVSVRAGAGTLVAPQQIAPTLESTGVATIPTFQWAPVTGANRYVLMVATSAAALPSDPTAMTCASCIVAGSTILTNYVVPSTFPNGGTASTFSAGTTYYWRIKGYNSLSTPITQGQLSPIWSFTTAPTATPVASVAVTPVSSNLSVGLTLQLTAMLRDASGFRLTGRSVAWSSSNPTIAVVSSDGVVSTLAAGTVTITAGSEGHTGTAVIVVMLPASSFRSLTAGSEHTCGLTNSGAAYCWGWNYAGQLGDASVIDRLSPSAVRNGIVFTSLSAGGGHTCGLTSGGVAYCWGANRYGQLGDGTTVDRATPVVVQGGTVFAAIAAGGFHTCAVTAVATLYCWGFNNSGQLGDGTMASRPTPVEVQGDIAFSSVATSDYYSCGVSTAGAAYCWGQNNGGTLGTGSWDSPITPTPVQGQLRFAAISLGGQHACGLTMAGAAYCWGQNTRGQLGNGASLPGAIWLAPSEVQGGHTFASIAVAGNRTCGLTTQGTIYCWGENSYGERGDGNPGDISTPVSVQSQTLFVALSTGEWHTCAETGAGLTYCWGLNNSGQLGDGTRTNRPGPTRVNWP